MLPCSRLKIYVKITEILRYLFYILFPLKNSKKNSLHTKVSQKVCDLIDTNYCVLTPTARVAIYLMLKNGLERGSRIGVTAFTLSEVINMILCAGHIPVFIDIDETHGNICLNELESVIDNKSIDALLVTHFFGRVSQMSQITEMCNQNQIPFFEDAAQVFGGRESGKFAGTFGKAGAFSFGQLKTTTCLRGGAVVTDDKELKDKIVRELNTWPDYSFGEKVHIVLFPTILKIATMQPFFGLLSFWIFRFGNRFNISLINNLLKIEKNPQISTKLNAKLKRKLPTESVLLLDAQIDEALTNIKKRYTVAKEYAAIACDDDWLKIRKPMRQEDVFYVHLGQSKRREELINYLYANNIDLGASYHKNCASLECFGDYRRDCPNAEAFQNEAVYLPCSTDVSKEQVARICMCVNSVQQSNP